MLMSSTSSRLLQVVWIKLYGSGCMDQVVWIKLYGSGCMDQVVWIRLYGSGCMDQVVWFRLYGSGSQTGEAEEPMGEEEKLESVRISRACYSRGTHMLFR